MFVWLIDWLIDRSCVRLIDWLIDRVFDRLIRLLRLLLCSIDWLIDWTSPRWLFFSDFPVAAAALRSPEIWRVCFADGIYWLDIGQPGTEKLLIKLGVLWQMVNRMALTNDKPSENNLESMWYVKLNVACFSAVFWEVLQSVAVAIEANYNGFSSIDWLIDPSVDWSADWLVC